MFPKMASPALRATVENSLRYVIYSQVFTSILKRLCKLVKGHNLQLIIFPVVIEFVVVVEVERLGK